MVCALAGTALAQSARTTVVDQTGLPLPGVTIQIVVADVPTRTLASESDGTFALESLPPDASLVLTLEGFDGLRVTPPIPNRIVLLLARAVDSTMVVAPETIE